MKSYRSEATEGVGMARAAYSHDEQLSFRGAGCYNPFHVVRPNDEKRSLRVQPPGLYLRLPRVHFDRETAHMHADVTRLLHQWSEGDHEALGRLLPILYDRLKRLAHHRLRDEGAGRTLSTTGLVHEAYLRLVDVDHVRWEDRAHFLAMSSRVMRRVLIDHARKRKAQKRGGGGSPEELHEEWMMPRADAERLLDLDDALHRLEADHPRKGKAVELRFFGGLTLEETASVLSISPPTVMRDVRFAVAWLARAWGTRPHEESQTGSVHSDPDVWLSRADFSAGAPTTAGSG